jgi:hypothetical protein
MSAASSGRVPREEAAMTEVGPCNVSEFFWLPAHAGYTRLKRTLIPRRVVRRFWQCYESGMFIPDPNFSIPDPGSKRFQIRIRIKEFIYL